MFQRISIERKSWGQATKAVNIESVNTNFTDRIKSKQKEEPHTKM